MESRRFVILPANLVLLILGLADLATTLIWLGSGVAVEANPVMAALLRAGAPVFAGVKLLTLAAYVLAMEWYRRRRSESFARFVGLLTTIAYAGIYAISFAVVNYPALLS